MSHRGLLLMAVSLTLCLAFTTIATISTLPKQPPGIRPGEHWTHHCGDGPWVVHKWDGSSSELICLNGVRVSLRWHCRLVETSRHLPCTVGQPSLLASDFPLYYTADEEAALLVRVEDGSVVWRKDQ